MKTLIVDDHPMFRRGVRENLQEHPRITSVAEADNGASAIQHMELNPPDIAIFDLALPEIDGLGLCEWVRENLPQTRCAILTMYDDREYLDRALELGAYGYILKDDSESDLHLCVDSIIGGEVFVSPRFGRPRERLYPLSNPEIEARLKRLTEVQRTIYARVGEFKTSREIADELNVSVRTVQNHRYAIANRLELSGPNELVRFASQYPLD